MSYESSNTGAGIDAAVDEVQAVSGDLVGTSDTQTLTNKTIDPSVNTIDGDKLDIDFNPSNYSPDSSISQADDVDDLSAHLKGVDVALRDIWKTLNPGFMTLPRFEYNGGTTAYTVKIGPSRGFCKDKYFYFTSELTSPVIGTPAADTRYYLYFDYSAMTDGNALTNSELVWSTTAPTYNGTYDQAMNGDDRFTGISVVTNSTPDNILVISHDGGDFVKYGEEIESRAYAVAVDTNFNAVALDLPDFGEDTKGKIHLYALNNDSTTRYVYIRKTGSGVTTGDHVSNVRDESRLDNQELEIFTDESQQIDVKCSHTNVGFAIYTKGYYMPRGMGR